METTWSIMSDSIKKQIINDENKWIMCLKKHIIYVIIISQLYRSNLFLHWSDNSTLYPNLSMLMQSASAM